MRHHILPALSLATLLLACAHDKNKTEAEAAEARTAETEGSERAEEGSERAEGEADRAERRADADGERVDVPRRRANRDRLASADGVPEGKDNEQSPETQGREPDNTGVNERDRDNANLTAGDQGNGEIDLDLTQRIRKAVMANDSLSFTAKNTKIITRDGRVTLRGPVKSQAEKDAIYKAAVDAAGAGRVTNQLEVDTD